MAEKEYIERGTFAERLQDFSEWCRDGRKQGVDFVLDCPLPNMPAADVVEVMHSEWILNNDGSATCKNCYMTTKYAWDYDNAFNYCPHCGAKMDGDTDNAE